MTNLSQCVCLQDFRQAAKQTLSKPIFQYIDSGSTQQQTLHQNSQSFHKLMIVPRILKSISNPNMNVKIFNRTLGLPFGFAPTAMQSISHCEGEVISSKIAQEKQIIMCLSLLSSRSLGDIVKVNNTGMKFLQLYLSNNWELTLSAIKLAEKYGFDGVVITVDAQILGVRRREKETPFDSSNVGFPVLDQIIGNAGEGKGKRYERRSWLANRDLGMTWQTIKKIRESTQLKIILKGIMNPKDAEIGINFCDAIWISNHGGRQLDSVAATIDILSGVKGVVGSKVPIFIDGGVRTGNDVFKCLALGADYVFLGRPVQYSMALGEEGLTKMVKILEDQLRRAMVLVGCHCIGDITAEHIVPEPML